MMKVIAAYRWMRSQNRFKLPKPRFVAHEPGLQLKMVPESWIKAGNLPSLRDFYFREAFFLPNCRRYATEIRFAPMHGLQTIKNGS